jgi:DNA-binding PucR family transcriptional regulator
VEGLRVAATAAIDYGLATVTGLETSPSPIPLVLLVQARSAARHGVSLDTVLRRYFAGYALLGNFVLEEAEDGELLHGTPLKRLLEAQAAAFDRLLAAVSDEYTRERAGRPCSAEERRTELIERLLAGERLDPTELVYDLEAVHLGLLAKGSGAAGAIRELARALDCRLLIASRKEEGTVWAWLGGRRAVDPDTLQRQTAKTLPSQVSLALGEPGKGSRGWRLTHQQARAALPIAVRSPEPVVRYADVALLASVLQNDLLATSLREIYLAPLERERNRGTVLRETLRAYFASDRNVTSAAAQLGINRNTVASRLHEIEVSTGRSLSSCAAEFEVALHLDRIKPTAPSGRADR